MMPTHSFSDFLSQQKYGFAWVAADMIGALLIVVSLFGLNEVMYWQTNGITTKATILDKYIREDCQTGGSGNSRTCIDNHYFKYRYQTNANMIYQDDDSVAQTLWKQHDVGSQVDILYSAIEPHKSSAAYADDAHTQKILWFIVLSIGILSMAIGVKLLLSQLARWRQLQQDNS